MELVTALLHFISAHSIELVGVILPPIVDIVNKDIKSDEERYLVTLLICLLTGAIMKWESLVVGSPGEALKSAGIVFFESQTVFKLYFKNSYLRARIQETIAKPTSPVNSPTPPVPSAVTPLDQVDPSKIRIVPRTEGESTSNSI